MESESTVFKSKYQELGIKCEDQVLNYYLNQNWRLYKRRQRLWGVEIDLILTRLQKNKMGINQQIFLFVEVKSLSENSCLEERWSYNQKKRFLRVARAISESSSESSNNFFIFRFVAVKHNGELIEINLEDII